MDLVKVSTALPSPAQGRHRKILANFEAAIGGREALTDALLHAPPSKALDALLAKIGDPLNDEASLGVLCAEAKLSMHEVWKLFSSSELARAQILALRKVTAQLPALTADVMTRSMTHEEVCYVCRGAGELPDPETGELNPCGACRGQGSTLQAPNGKDREHALKLGGLLKDGAGVQIVNQQQTLVAGGGGLTRQMLDDLTAGTDRVLYPDVRRQAQEAEGEIVEAEVEVAGEAAEESA